MRAMGTKDYNTMNASLERTQGVAEVVGADPLGEVYRIVDSMLLVNYVNHGPDKFNGQASFEIKQLENGSILLLAHDKLWNEDFTKRNDAVAVLDGKTDGFYYDEAMQWIQSH